MSRTKFHKIQLEMPLLMFKWGHLTFSGSCFIHSSAGVASTISIWCRSHLKITPDLCMSPSVRETSSQKACFCVQGTPPSLQKHPVAWRPLKCFPFCLHLGRFFFFYSSFLMVFSEGSKWHWSVKVDSKIYNVFVLAECQQNRPFPAVLYADSENQ